MRGTIQYIYLKYLDNDKALEELKKLSLVCDFKEAESIKKVIENYNEDDIKEIQCNLLNNTDIRIKDLKG